jgi:cell division protein ZapE
VVFVGGEDYRRQMELERPGRGWVGPPAATRALLDAALAAAEAEGLRTRRLTFGELLHLATEVAHDRLVEQLSAADRLAVEDIRITGTDDALRLLRLVDDLYTRPDAPALFFTAEAPPEAWFDPDAHAGLAQGIAEKFTRTVSRLYALCDVRRIENGE